VATAVATAAVAAALLLAGTAPVAGRAAVRAPRHVVLLGIDGLGGDWVANASAPTLHALAANGTSTLAMQNVLGTSSSQNWFAMISGTGPDQNGVYTNLWRRPRNDSALPPTIFATWRAQRPNATIGLIHEWAGFGRLVEDNVCDLKVSPGDYEATTDAAVAYLRSDRPDLLMVVWDLVDHAGHDYGWGSPEYYAAIATADGLVRRVLDALADAGMLDETAVIVSADHGGNARGKHGADQLPLRSVPFLAAGAGVWVGRSVAREVRIFDIAPTVAELAGLARPAAWIGTPVYEAVQGGLPPPTPPSPAPLDVALTTEYTLLYNSTGEPSGFVEVHSVWRPVAPAGYATLGDVAVRGLAAPTFATPVVRDVADLVAPPAAFERVWTNEEFASYSTPVTYWSPIPSYGYVCLGSHAATSLPSEREPPRDALRCVLAPYARAAAEGGVAVVRNAGFTHLENGWAVSLWEADGAPDGGALATHSFLARRDLHGPGYPKLYWLQPDPAAAARAA